MAQGGRGTFRNALGAIQAISMPYPSISKIFQVLKYFLDMGADPPDRGHMGGPANVGSQISSDL